MPTVLRQRSLGKHRRVVRLTHEEWKRALASGFTASELNAPMHDSRRRRLMVALGLKQPPRSPAAPVLHSTDKLAPPPKAPVTERPARDEEVEQLSGVEGVPTGDWYRPWPGEIPDEKLEALLQ